jgi:Cu/Ag efflux protein CusF
MRKVITAVVVVGALAVQAVGASADLTRIAQATGEKSSTPSEKMPGRAVMGATKVRGSISAIDKEAGTVTLKGPKGRTVTLEVRDKQKFDVLKVGDPVVAVYVEAIGFQARKAGSGSPGTTMQETRVSSKPGETPAGAVGREITVTGTITAIDKKAKTVTIKGPGGESETIKAQDPKNLELVKVGDLVDVTYTQALAISLDKPAK